MQTIESHSKSAGPGCSPLETPLYGIGEVAHYLALPRSTVQSWVKGGEHFQPVIAAADEAQWILSFQNLQEVFVLSSLRRRYGVKLNAVRRALDYMRDRFGTAHPLSDSSFFTDGRNIFVEQLGRLIDVSTGGQLAMKKVLDEYLKRLALNQGVAVRLYPYSTSRPYGPDSPESPRVVVIDPVLVFGQPCIEGTRIPTSVIAERHRAGDRIAHLAADYGCEADRIEEALRYESTRTAA